MRLAINGRFLTQDVTGVQRVARELVNGIDELLREGSIPFTSVRIVAPNRDLIDTPTLTHIPIVRVGHLSGHMWEQLELSPETGPEMLLCLGNTAPSLRMMAKSPTAVLIHSLSYEYFPSAYSAAFRAAYKIQMPITMARASALFTVSEAERDRIAEYFPDAAHRMKVVENGGLPDAIVDQVASADKGDDAYLLYVGSLTKLKNAERLLRTAVALAKDEGLKFKLVGSSGSVFSNFNIEVPEEVRNRVEFLGHINDPKELVPLYRNAICLLFPSFYESSGIPPMEAMSSGCPVVCSDIPVLRERCGEAAEYCDPASDQSITNAVLKVAKNPELRDQMRKAGMERSRNYRWKNSAEKLLSILYTDNRSQSEP